MINTVKSLALYISMALGGWIINILIKNIQSLRLIDFFWPFHIIFKKHHVVTYKYIQL